MQGDVSTISLNTYTRGNKLFEEKKGPEPLQSNILNENKTNTLVEINLKQTFKYVHL